jgi:hypothetical protein
MAVALVPAVDRTREVSRPPVVGPGRLRKIGFLGSHEASLKAAPWHDPTWELWGHASSRLLYRREPERYFDLHRKECWAKSNNKGAKYLRWLASNHTPIFMWERYPEVPASVAYPLEQVSFGMARKYFTNHVAYMIALALAEGVTHLGFFGVNYSPDCEYGTQRGSAEYWMGRAEGLGVQLVIPDACTLLADPKPLYGYASHDADGKLVEAYTKRVWTVQPPAQPVPVDARGLELPPAHLAADMAKERREYAPPPGYLGPPIDVDIMQRAFAADLAKSNGHRTQTQ